MDTGCPAFIPEPHYSPKHRDENPSNKGPKDNNEHFDDENAPFPSQNLTKSICFIRKQFLPIPLS